MRHHEEISGKHREKAGCKDLLMAQQECLHPPLTLDSAVLLNDEEVTDDGSWVSSNQASQTQNNSNACFGWIIKKTVRWVFDLETFCCEL